MKRLLTLCLALVLVDACVDPLEVAIPEVKFQLVVDGFITNDPGPYTVKLYRARALETDLDRLIVERFAKISLKDNLGNSELLTEVSEGVYQTAANGTQGQIGRSYHLEIVTVTGKKFYSDPEELLPVGGIDDVYYELGETGSEKGFRVFVDAKGVPERDDLIRFRMVGTYEVETFPQLRTIKNEAGTVPNPFPCSGYGVNENGALTRQTDCACCHCWVNQYDDIPVVADEQFGEKDQFKGVEVGFVPINKRTFYNKYKVEVQQMSVTPTTHQFWKLIRAQKIGATDLFQPPAAPIRGNIHAESEAELNPLGIFWAAGMSRKAVFIERRNVPFTLQPIDTMIAPCLFVPYSSNQRPTLW